MSSAAACMLQTSQDAEIIPPVLSKRKNVIINRSQRAAKKATKAQWKKIIRRILFWTLFIAFISVCIWILFFSAMLEVTLINVANKRIERSKVEDLVRQRVAGAYWGVLPKNNLIVIPEKQIEQDLKDNFNLIKEVTVTRVFPNALLVELAERESEIVWCQQGECYLVDENGTVFYKLKPTDEELYRQDLVRVEDRSQSGIEVGKTIVDPSAVAYLIGLVSKFEQHGQLEIQPVFWTPSAISGEIRVRTKAGWEIFLNLAQPVEGQVGILKKVIQEKVSPEKIDDLQYIDLRLKERVVYKLNEQPLGEEEAKEGINENDQPEAETAAPLPEVKSEKNDKKKDKQ